jgi:prefoldin subunit 5
MLTILFLASNPTKTGRLRLDKECREIKEKLKLSENSKQFNFISEWAVRIKNLLDFVTEKNPDVIHFSGHGEDSDIILEGEDGNPVTVSKSAIIRLIGRCKNLKLVVFNTCHSISFAQEAVKKINFAIGMNGPISDDSAIVFGYRLYASLGTGRSVEDSYEDALTEIELKGLSGVDIPQLYIKEGVNKNISLINTARTLGNPVVQKETSNKFNKIFEFVSSINLNISFRIKEVEAVVKAEATHSFKINCANNVKISDVINTSSITLNELEQLNLFINKLRYLQRSINSIDELISTKNSNFHADALYKIEQKVKIIDVQVKGLSKEIKDILQKVTSYDTLQSILGTN